MSIITDLTIKALATAVFAFIILGTVLAAFGINILDLIFNPDYLREMQHPVRWDSSQVCVTPRCGAISSESATGIFAQASAPSARGNNGVGPWVTISAVHQHLNRGDG